MVAVRRFLGGSGAEPPAWWRTPAFHRISTVAVFGIGLGIANGRYDVIVLVAPILLAGVLALTAPLRRGRGPSSAATSARGMVTGSRLPIRVRLSGVGDAELVTVRIPESTRNPMGATVTVAGGAGRGDGADELELIPRIRVRGWGSTLIARPDVAAITGDGLYLAPPVRTEPLHQVILPGVLAMDALPLPPITGGWAGSHVSRRPGQGSDLVDLRDYAPGDRMRSVHWRAFARRGKLYTRRTLSEAEAELALCIDVRQVTGPRVEPAPAGRLDIGLAAVRDLLARMREDSAGDAERLRGKRIDALEQAAWTSIDLTVHAVAAIGAAHLGSGDRVSVQTVDAHRRLLAAGGGQRQIDRIRYFVASLASRSARLLNVQYWVLRPGSVVVLFTPLQDDAIADAARIARARGHRVIVIDTLPVSSIIDAAPVSEHRQLALLSVSRALRIEKIRAAGIPVLNWERGSVEHQMAQTIAALRARR